MLLSMARHLHPPDGAAMLRLAGWIAVLCCAVWFLTALGRGALGIPSILDPAAWGPWAAGRDATVIAFALLRAATMVVAWYLLGATVIGMVARLLHSARLVTVTDLLTVPAVRRLLQSALGVGLATAALTAGSPGAGPMQAQATPTASAPAEPEAIEMTPRDDGSAVLVPVPPLPQTAQPAPPAQPPTEWKVRPGEHFWSIAEAVVGQAGDRAPSDEEVTEYWERLVAANRSRLADRANPDLLYPGQTLHLPSTGRD